MKITFTEQEIELVNKAISAARVDIYQAARVSEMNLTGVDLNCPNDDPVKQRVPMLIHREGINESLKVHEQLSEAQKMIMSKFPECGSHKLEIEYQIQYYNHSSTWEAGINLLDPDEAKDKLGILTRMNPNGKYRIVRRELREEAIDTRL
jgi:hypothetical protein